ncbi:MAG: nucleotide exchange factor GrpE [Chloroflexi bacterium]|nr:MAG: nucleotide exchange factor GrpE [Chloroflexota bacterium]TMB94426.1 MAG: nucleotide exchange factor GrpE [Chloroflexota bacterium]TMC27296.1 MAG: nucleotide exchange factor GrpE [Chloroflexota bacterium]TMC33209.1 MAG: nucleotide exchange factor GrpE [Chloroflexota bacterium]TMC56002.1 MAG: nucleotide exchange factor GrpE [Chloroflexota bacterium]
MDEKTRRAEELLEERLKRRGPNGHTNIEEDGAKAAAQAATDEAPTSDSVEALTNDLKRMTADFSNYRKRNEAERAEFAKFAKADLIARLLDILDGYDRALATIPEELRNSSWVEGMWLIERKLRQILEAEGLQAVDSLGKPFDPYEHEAVAHVESDEPEGTVIREHQKAYRLHDRVIRPAMVTVAKKKESN